MILLNLDIVVWNKCWQSSVRFGYFFDGVLGIFINPKNPTQTVVKQYIPIKCNYGISVAYQF